MKRILVTGGTGFIGSHTVVELQNQGFDVVIVDNLSNSKETVVDSIEKITGVKPAFEKVDCTDFAALENVFRKYDGIEAIIHFAASKAVGESVQKPLMYYRNNIVSLINLLELMPKYGVRGFVFSSSCTVYPIGAHPTALIGELPNGVPQNLIPYLTQTAIGIRKELSVFGDDYNTPDGSCIRDYIYVVDLAKAHVCAINRILNNEQKEKVEAFNIGTGRGVSVLELINAFEKATGVKVPHRIVGRRAGDIEKIWADPQLANNELGWKADTDLEETLRTAWKWQLKLREDGVM